MVFFTYLSKYKVQKKLLTSFEVMLIPNRSRDKDGSDVFGEGVMSAYLASVNIKKLRTLLLAVKL